MEPRPTAGSQEGSWHKMAPHLTSYEELTTKKFLKEINKWTALYNVSPIPWKLAVRFLTARKFDVRLAVELFRAYVKMRQKEGILNLRPDEEPLRSEILSGKFTVLNTRDPSGASIAIFTAKLHHPHKSAQRVVLQALFYLLDRALDSFETQRNGLVFIYDMEGSKYNNFDLKLGKKVLKLLKAAFPARLKKIFIVEAPMWFRVPYSIISILLKGKACGRIQIIRTSKLTQHLPPECLPESLGGYVKLDLTSWNFQFLPHMRDHEDPLGEIILLSLTSSEESHSVDHSAPPAMNIEELLDHFSSKQRRGIYKEFENINYAHPVGTFHNSILPGNLEKNRYEDVPCLDETRVKLMGRMDDTQTDYINANFIDGYNHKNAYIGTQGPLENTFGDFWLMVWEQKVLVIVMITQLEERGKRKCGQYWPMEKDDQFQFDSLVVTNEGVEHMNYYKKTTLEIHNVENQQKRQVTHLHFLNWPDYGVPATNDLIKFLIVVRKQQMKAIENLEPSFNSHPKGPPIVIHCSAGIGRTGTFCLLDICLAELEALGMVNVFQILSHIRAQRALSIQNPEQYYFCYKAIIEYARKMDMLPSATMSGNIET
ncbi:tyrosine-protein phosphatase non-receptor type 9-like [Antechinus flavipes]|uniref:tyrosine-protein phosphatase non-receptor type 9-like n=1 Tax=Antechinus flavipes TaxID=38775 RepID=UPI002235B625|nr:tyrosine-protein phosphatase non-receptor type 9-like [Antechinus flavipes]